MKVNSIIEKKSKQVKASEKKPKLNKPNLGHESPHPMQGRMVGESELDNMDLQDRLLANVGQFENKHEHLAGSELNSKMGNFIIQTYLRSSLL